MNLIVNGKAYVHRGEGALPSLLEEQKVIPEHVAVMINDRIIPRADFQRTILHNGDNIEILVFAGGG